MVTAYPGPVGKGGSASRIAGPVRLEWVVGNALRIRLFT